MKFFQGRLKTHKIKRIVDIYSKRFWIFGVVFLVFLFICLILWTWQYGSIFGMFQYATAIRDGLNMNNSLAVFSRFCRAFPLIFYAFAKISVHDYKIRSKRFLPSLVVCLLALFGSVVDMINVDGRGNVVIFVLIFAFLFFGDWVKKIIISKKPVLFVGLIAVLILGMCSNLSFFQSDYQQDSDGKNVVKNFFIEEWSYVYTNMVNTFYMYDNQKIGGDRLKENIINIPFAWLPMSMKPDDMQNMNQYNTSLYSNATGELPIDIVSGSIINMGWAGLLIVPMFYGWLIVIIEKYLIGVRKWPFYEIIYYCFGIRYMQCFVTYIDIAPILLAMFGFIVYVVSAQLICGRRIQKVER
ncbi:MAG: O-antigen polymerase [Candidatus Saccharibacteria bacterium]|nr:O-antigen polymerase [Candidatus Saccharibacteria bacterium]